jgi:hypothetical protein
MAFEKYFPKVISINGGVKLIRACLENKKGMF